MQYMNRPAPLFADLPNLLPEIRSLVTFLVPYHGASSPPLVNIPRNAGRIARYAWGEDYHQVLRKKLKAFVQAVCAEIGLAPEELKARVFSDAVPLLERAFAAGSDLGFIGKNTMLIRPKLGSFTFLCEVLWNIEVVNRPSRPRLLEVAKCGTCERCLQSCPTGALIAPFQLDGRLCISYLTIEKRGVLSDVEARQIGEWLFGCDICQEVCPFNAATSRGEENIEFSAERGAGPFLELEEVLALDAQAFKARFAHTPLMRSGREGLVRNAICVAVNKQYRPAKGELQRLLHDTSEVIRAQAEWGLANFL